MFKRRTRQRLYKAGEQIFHSWKLLAALIAFLLTVIFASWIDRHFGSPVVTLIESYWLQYGSDVLKVGLVLISKNPVETSIITFFLTLSVVVVLAAWETRDIAKVQFDYAFLDEVKCRDGISATNMTGDDIKNCTMDLVEIDGKMIAWYQLDWGYHYVADTVDIQNTRSSNIRLSQILFKLHMSMGGRPGQDWSFIDKQYEIGLSFHANDKVGKTITIPVWVKFRIEKATIDEEKLGYNIFVDNIET